MSQTLSPDLPVTVTAAGAQPQLPAVVRAALVALIAADWAADGNVGPPPTDNLPGSLVEDITSTDVAAILQADAARVELINSLTPRGANAFLLNQLGQIYGVPQAATTNTSVDVAFTVTSAVGGSPLPGYFVPKGFTVTDGTYQYVIQDGGVTDSGGVTAPLFALAVQLGSWVIPSGSVTQIVTQPPPGVAIAVNNPAPGTPSPGPQTQEAYAAAVLQAGLAASTGMATTLRTNLERVAGVQPRLIAIVQNPIDVNLAPPLSGGWKIIVGGGDPYQVGGAIFQSLFDIADLAYSVTWITAFTNANPGVATTLINHGFTTGETVTVQHANPGTFDGTYTVTVIDEKTFSVGVDTTGFGSYVGTDSGYALPNTRDRVIDIFDFPDTYTIVFVVPPQQTVTMAVTWNTTSPNFVDPNAMAQLAAPALAGYINSIFATQPINVLSLEDVFIDAVASILARELISSLSFSVSINGVPTSETGGTNLIYGDPESYFFALASGISVTQG